MRGGRRSDHQGEYQKHTDDLRAGRHRNRDQGEESNRYEPQWYALGFRQFRLKTGKYQRAHDNRERGQRDCPERGQCHDHRVVDRQHIAEQNRRRLRSERRVVVQEQEAKAERQRQHHADGNIPVADALAERAYHNAGSHREAEQAP